MKAVRNPAGRRERIAPARFSEASAPIPLADPISVHPDATASDAAAPDAASRSRIRPWLLVVGLALVAALGIRLFVAEAFRIPTASMEQNLLVGDFVLVSKLHYGPRTPVTLGLPFTDRYLGGVAFPPLRLPGFSAVERGDVVVFNHPAGGEPVDRRMHFIKRVVGVPGDTVALVEKEVQVNGEPLPTPPGVQTDWLVTLDSAARLSVDVFREIGADPMMREDEGRWRVRMTEAEAEAVATWEAVRTVRPAVSDRAEMLFPYHARQTLDDYGPVAVPRRGQTVRLTLETWPVVRDVIERHEGRTARRFADGRYEIDGALTDRYTFEQDYYFVLGDNRDDSSDSRRWGFVPRDHLVGKAVMVYFSWDQRTRRPRLDRLFHPVR
jgi:signal peptidase I